MYRERRDYAGLADALSIFGGTVGTVYGLGRARTIVLAEEALAGLGGEDPHLKAILLFQRAGQDGDEAAVHAAEEAEALARTYGYQDIQARLLVRESNRARQQMRLDDAVALARRAVEAVKRSGNIQPMGSFSALVGPLFLMGKLNEAEAASAEAVDWCRRVHLRPN